MPSKLKEFLHNEQSNRKNKCMSTPYRKYKHRKLVTYVYILNSRHNFSSLISNEWMDNNLHWKPCLF